MGTTTPRSDAEMLAEIEADRDEPIGPPVDGTPVRAIREAAERRQRADDEITEAVAGARALGISWTLIGEALGVSRQAARPRYG